MSLWDRLQAAFAASPVAAEPEVRMRTMDDIPTDLADQLLKLHGLARPWRAASINEALGVPAIFRAVSLIANVTGSLSLEAFRQGTRIANQTDVPRLVIRPNPFTTPRDFFRDTAFYLATRGEAWWWVANRDPDGQATALYPVPPWEVTVAANSLNRLRPTIQWQGRTIDNDDMRHITYLRGDSGLRGVGPLQLCDAAASVSVESQEWAANFFAGNLPSAIGETEMDLSEDDVTNLNLQWYEKVRSNIPMFVGGGLKMKDFGIDPAKAQLKDSREFQVGEVARMFGIPGPLLEFNAPGSSLNYSNDETVWREFQAGCLSPYYLEPIEQEMSDLLTRSTVARFNLAQLLRADTKTRYDIYGIGIDKGIFGPEYAAQQEGITAGGVDFAPVPLALPSSVPTILPPDRQQLRTAAELRCTKCNKMLAEFATPPYRLTCPRCKTVVSDERVVAAEPDLMTRSLAGLLTREQPQPNITVTPSVTFDKGAVQLDSPDVTRLADLMADIQARQIESDARNAKTLETMQMLLAREVPPPIVNVSPPEVTVHVPESRPVMVYPKKTSRRIERDKDGRMIRVVDEPMEESA